ncbi:BnaC08g42020D [Brassica napus]|uniref:BnaC08g42020D protein n=1 Tax=Brassica napus TaxID=3708 RepID=A0A078HCX2_BRANA|nr:BnaC08g42020D [Brassica napus]
MSNSTQPLLSKPRSLNHKSLCLPDLPWSSRPRLMPNSLV